MQNKKDSLLSRWYEEVWNKGNEAAIDEMFRADGTIHGLGAGDLRGTEEFKPFFHTFINDFSDIHVDVLEVISEGETEVAHCRATGLHKSTGRQVDFEGACIVKIKDGKIYEAWNFFDFIRMNEQLTAADTE